MNYSVTPGLVCRVRLSRFWSIQNVPHYVYWLPGYNNSINFPLPESGNGYNDAYTVLHMFTQGLFWAGTRIIIKILRNGGFENLSFFESAILKKKNKKKMSRFDDYPGFQPKTNAA